VRWPRIARRVVRENDYPDAINDRIRALVEDIPEAPVRPLDDPGAPDEALWNGWIDRYCGQTWLEIPWFIGETYFYRRIIEATGYFRPGPGRFSDPFLQQKQAGYDESRDAIQALARARAQAEDTAHPRAELVRLLKMALWGNQADLSMWDADAEERLARIGAPPTDDATYGGVWTTAHNFDFVGDRLYTSWYRGGVKVHDVSDPSTPGELGHWRATETTSFWTAQKGDGDYLLASSWRDPSQETPQEGAAVYSFPALDSDPTPEEGANSERSGTGFGFLVGAVGLGIAALARRVVDRS
jgi:hypothetical protein